MPFCRNWTKYLVSDLTAHRHHCIQHRPIESEKHVSQFRRQVHDSHSAGWHVLITIAIINYLLASLSWHALGDVRISIHTFGVGCLYYGSSTFLAISCAAVVSIRMGACDAATILRYQFE